MENIQGVPAPKTTSSLDLKQLKVEYQLLKDLCLNWDPFTQKISQEQKSLLYRYGIDEIQDPFMITNRLLRLLDQIEVELKLEDESQ